MKNRYILLILFILFALYLLWCNISIIYTRKGNTKIPLIENINYQTDSFQVGKSTVFWQGFYHEWTYNHRVNRLGDWIENISYSENNNMRAVLNHSAATGSGADVLNYLTFFTYLKSEKARFFSSSVSTTIRGREATTTTKTITITGKWPAELNNYTKGIIVLNGFDIYCSNRENGKVMGTGDADKLSNLYIEIDNLHIQNGKFKFDLTLKLGADCDSPECLNFSPGDNEWFDYQFKVAYQVITFNEAVHITNKNLTHQYSWRKPFKSRPEMDPNEIYRNDKVLSKQIIKGIAGYNVGIPLVNKIDISLPKGKGGLIRKRMETPHLLSLNIAINDFNYNVATGTCTYDADLFFKNWQPKMHVLAYGNDGKATINLGLKLLQINDPAAVMETQYVKGEINWETTHLDQRLGDDPKSIKTFILNKQ